MKIRTIIKNILRVTFSNFSTIIAGIFVAFIIPKILSVEEYGLYKTFTLYTTYLGLFSLGIVDGIVLKYGEKNYDELDRKKFRTFFTVYIWIHLFFMIVLLTSFKFINNKFIIYMLGINMIITNFTGYFQQISQITQRFKEYAIRKILQSIINIFTVFVMIILYKCFDVSNYKIYIGVLLVLNSFLLIWYIFTYKDICFGEKYKIKECKKEISELIKNGFPLLIANLCSTLILTLDRQFVNVLFDNYNYAIYAFAYSMISLVTVATSAIATVLYPTLKRIDEKNLEDKYSNLISIILLLVYGLLVSFFPIKFFVIIFLEKYIDSVIIFRIIFPGIVISSVITVVMHNYYKILGKNNLYFINCILILIISFIANMVAYYIFRNMYSISIASVISLLLWYFLCESFFTKKYNRKNYRNNIYLLIMMIIFYLSTEIDNIYLSCFTFLISYSLISYICFKDLLIVVIRRLHDSKENI